MTFSEYIAKYAYRAYLEYCKQNHLKPEVDTKVVEPKLCRLVKPRVDKTA